MRQSRVTKVQLQSMKGMAIFKFICSLVQRAGGRRVGAVITAGQVLIMLMLLPVVASGEVFNVSTVEAFQTALLTAQTNGQDDTINLSGIYNVDDLPGTTLNYTADDDPVENYALTIQATNGTATIDGGGKQALKIETFISGESTADAHVTIKGLTIKYGLISSEMFTGGGLYVRTQNANILVESCYFVSNRATHIYNDPNAGGVFLKAGGSGSIIVKKNTFIGNNANGFGGGLYTVGGNPNQIVDNLFVGNEGSTAGGAVYMNSPTELIFQNNTLVANGNDGCDPSRCGGGGLYVRLWGESASVKIFNNIFWTNTSATGKGDDVYLENDADGNSTGAVVNVWNNDYIDLDYEVVDGLSTNDNLHQDPVFVNTATNNYRLEAGSPCIDIGTNQDWMTGELDLDGNARVFNGIVDLGAYEYITNDIVVIMSSLTENPTRTSSIPVTVTFSEHVTGFTNTDIIAGNGYTTNFTAVNASNYTFNLTPTNQGTITADIPASVALGSNSMNIAAVQFTRVYDTIGPTGVITSTSGSPTNASTIGFSVMFNEGVSGFESNDVTLITSGTATGAPPALSGAGSNYTVSINNVTGNGWLTVWVDAEVCIDLLGNSNSVLSAVSNQIDTVRPACTIARVGASPTNATVVRFSVSFNESVGGFGLSGITLTNTGAVSGQLTDLAGSGAAYTVDVSNVSGDGEIGIQVGTSNAWDLAGNGNKAGAQTNYVIDQTAPTVSVSSPSSTLTSTNPVSYTITYLGADLVSLTTDDVSLNQTGTATGTVAVTGSGSSNRTVTISSLTGDGTLGITLPAGTARDSAGNFANTVGGAAFVIDNTAPSISISSTSSMITGYSPIPVTVTFSEAITGFSSSDLNIQNATFIHFVVLNASTYMFDLVPSSIGIVQVDISSDVATDAVGHGNTAASPFQRVYSLVPPENISASDGTHTDKVRITWTVDNDATQFIVYRHTSDQPVSASQLATITGLGYDDLGASPGIIYCYWVKAIYPAETSAFSDANTGYRSLPVPVGFSATDGTYRSKIRLSWSVSDDATNYRIYRYKSQDDIATAISLVETSATIYDDTTTVPGVVYNYWVTASSGVAVSQASALDSGWCLNPCNTIANCDFDGDRLADPSVYEETNGNWCVKLSANDYNQVMLVNSLGGACFSPAGADYDGDGLADPAVYEETTGNWCVLLSRNNYARLGLDAFLGGPGYAPISADYDGDGLADPAVYSTATGDWLVLLSGTGYSRLEVSEFLSVPGTLPASADYDGDGLADPAVYLESTGDWILLLSKNNYGQLELSALLGGPGYLPVPGDYDGDGLADPAVYNPSTGEWRILLSSYNYGVFSTWLQF